MRRTRLARGAGLLARVIRRPNAHMLTYGGLVAGLPNYDALGRATVSYYEARGWSAPGVGECVTDPDGADGRIPGHPHA